MNEQAMIDQIIRHEGFSATVYKCTAGRYTIGYGREISTKGITEREAIDLLNHDIYECFLDLTCLFPDQFNDMPGALQQVLVDMRFQLGPGGFRNFKKMIRAIKRNDLPGMIREMKDSRWYHQTKNRADDLIRMVEPFIKSQS